MRNDERAYLLQRKKSANMMRLQDHKSRLVIPGETGSNCQDSNGAPMTKKKKKKQPDFIAIKMKMQSSMAVHCLSSPSNLSIMGTLTMRYSH